jgi:cytochrome oxidase Cu insertion factor (SCO1/SenC/PrrC family)
MVAADATNGMAPARIAEDIISLRRAPARREELVAMLAEQSPVYQGLGSGEAERIRGFVLASFEKVGLPETALPFVLEELQTGLNPYTVAAAAKGLRGAGLISDDAVKMLGIAALRIENDDDNVQHETFDPGDRTPARTSALAEIVRTIGLSGASAQHLRGTLDEIADRGNISPEVAAAIVKARQGLSGETAGHCCCSTPPPMAAASRSPVRPTVDDTAIGDLALEDQSGATFNYADFFHGRPSVLTFFYTRCMNPKKCSLTISKLTGLQRRLAQRDIGQRINVAAFTYDPAHDRNHRLQTYGLERGFRFDARNRFVRTVASFEPVQAKFGLGVGFGPSTVNQHSVDLLILNSSGEAVRQFSRVQWEEADVLEALDEILAAAESDTASPFNGGARPIA